MKDSRLKNIWFINTGVLLIALLLITKLGYIQIAKGEYYQDLAESKYLVSSLGTFDRGTIFFSEKSGRKISAATVVPDYTLAIDPTKVTNKGALADKLLQFVKFDRADFIARAGREGDQYEEIARHLSEKEVAGIRALGDTSVILEKNKKRYDKKLFTKQTGGAKIGLYAGLEESDEAQFVARKAKEIIETGDNPEEIAILYRANWQSRILEEALLRAEVPYQVLGTRFFDRKEIKDIVSFIKVALNPNDFEAMKRIINIPPRGIGKTTLLKVATGQEASLPPAMRQKIASFRELLSAIAAFAAENKPSELIKFIIRLSGLEEMLKKGSEDELERLDNIKEFASLATKYDHLPTDEAVPIMLSEIALASEQDSLEEKKPGVKLMTVHASKGLEFDTVFIVGLEDGLFPHRGIGDSPKDEEEERRLFYVAVTRARKKLYLSYTESRLIFGSRQRNMPSEFIFDIDENLLETESGLWTIL